MDCRRSFAVYAISSGFTLFELITALAVTAILVGLAMPAFTALIHAANLNTQTHRFVAAYQLARNEAIKRNAAVILCPNNNGACDQKDDWSLGWLVFVDRDGDRVADPDELIRYFEPLSPGFRLAPNVKTLGLVFRGDGGVRRLSGALPLMSFWLCRPGATTEHQARKLVINAAGRLRVQQAGAGELGCL